MPPEYLKVLQDAFMKAMKDPELIAEAKAKKIGLENPMSGPDMLAYVKRVYALLHAAKKLAKKALSDDSFVEDVKYTTFKGELTKATPKGKSPHGTLIFKSNGKFVTVHLDARTTQLTSSGREILIPPLKIKEMSAGMKCDISWTGPGTTAGKLVCN